APGWSGLGEYFRDVHDHMIRINHSIDAARDTIATAIQVNLAMVQVAESEVTKRLAAYAALVAVPTMIVGVYGMNFEHIPELKWGFGYPLVMALIGATDGVLFYSFREAAWRSHSRSDLEEEGASSGATSIGGQSYSTSWSNGSTTPGPARASRCQG